MLSIIIPTDENAFGPAENLRGPGVELIFIPLASANTRAERINLGVERSNGEMILLHHPRSRLSKEAVQILQDRKAEKFWGGFTHCFDLSHPLLRFTSFYSNHVRAPFGKVVYLDHCIFFHRSFWQPLPKVAIFEDTLLSKSLSHYGVPEILPQVSLTSAIRFTKNGVWWQSLLIQFLKIGYYLNISHERLNALYEKGLDLNAKK